MSSTPNRAEILEARVVHEEDWAFEAWRARMSWSQMRIAALAPVDAGGLGYALSESALRGLVKSARARHGDLSMTREERAERMQEEIDERNRRASFDLAQAHAALNAPPIELTGMETPAEVAKLREADAKIREAAAKMLESADRRLAAAQRDERDLHGLNAPTKIEAEVTTRDAVTDELNAMLIRAGRDPIEVDS